MSGAVTGSGATTVVVEVTDTLGIDFTTGIQRVVREVVKGLQGPAGHGLEVVPVVRPSTTVDFRRLTDDEADRLRHHPSGGRAGRRADDFGPLSPLVRRVGDLRAVVAVRSALAARRRDRRALEQDDARLALGPIPPGSVFLDLEGSWYAPTSRAELLPELRSRGVHPVVLVHDVMPVVRPEWFTATHRAVFREWLDAHLHHSEVFLANSACTARDLRAVAAEAGRPDLDVTVIPLGADYPAPGPRPVDVPGDLGRYLLVVGTLEPRKNQRVVLDAWERLRADHPDLGLVLVGKEGWMVDDLVARIRNHPTLGDRLHWLGGVDDPELAWLYDHAFVTVAPSLYEGLGLPVLEALRHGCATITSAGGAQEEAAGPAAETFDPTDVGALTELLRRHLEDEAHHARMVERARAHHAPTWAETAGVVATAIRSAVTEGRTSDR